MTDTKIYCTKLLRNGKRTKKRKRNERKIYEDCELP